MEGASIEGDHDEVKTKGMSEEWYEEREPNGGRVVLSALLWSSSRVWLTSNFVDIPSGYEVNHYAKA